MERLTDRVAVVTGSASGIGLGIAERFLQEGMKVVLADRDEAALDRVLVRLAALGNVIAKPTDVSDAASIEELADAAMAKFGAVHLLVNNAGVGGFQTFSTTSLEAWDWVLGVNLKGVIHGCKTFLPILAAQDEAHIVNTSSISGMLYLPYLHPYNVSKAGIVALTEGLYLEFGMEHINVGISVLVPGSTATNLANDERNAPAGLVRRSLADPGDRTKAIREAVEAANAAGKTPAELADYVVRGIRERRLHIWSHPEWFGPVKERIEAISQGKPVANPLLAAG